MESTLLAPAGAAPAAAAFPSGVVSVVGRDFGSVKFVSAGLCSCATFAGMLTGRGINSGFSATGVVTTGGLGADSGRLVEGTAGNEGVVCAAGVGATGVWAIGEGCDPAG